MEILNSINKSMQDNKVSSEVIFESYKTLILLLNPITPHICYELGELLNISELSKEKSWPKVDANFIEEDHMLIIVQINGKVRKKIEVDSNISQESLEEYTLGLA